MEYDGPMVVYKKVNGKWQVVAKTNNPNEYEKLWVIADDLSNQGFTVKVD